MLEDLASRLQAHWSCVLVSTVFYVLWWRASSERDRLRKRVAALERQTTTGTRTTRAPAIGL